MRMSSSLHRSFLHPEALRLFVLGAACAFLSSCTASMAPLGTPSMQVGLIIDYSHPVFFEWNSVDLTDRGRQTVAESAKRLGTIRKGTTWIELGGHTDRTGTPDYNQRLGRRRGEAVAAELRRNGIPPEQITVTVFGETRPLVPTKDGLHETRNRRVEIVRR